MQNLKSSWLRVWFLMSERTYFIKVNRSFSLSHIKFSTHNSYALGWKVKKGTFRRDLRLFRGQKRKNIKLKEYLAEKFHNHSNKNSSYIAIPVFFLCFYKLSLVLGNLSYPKIILKKAVSPSTVGKGALWSISR